MTRSYTYDVQPLPPFKTQGILHHFFFDVIFFHSYFSLSSQFSLIFPAFSLVLTATDHAKCIFSPSTRSFL